MSDRAKAIVVGVGPVAGLGGEGRRGKQEGTNSQKQRGGGVIHGWGGNQVSSAGARCHGGYGRGLKAKPNSPI